MSSFPKFVAGALALASLALLLLTLWTREQEIAMSQCEVSHSFNTCSQEIMP